jgi:hypothetical protein
MVFKDLHVFKPIVREDEDVGFLAEFSGDLLIGPENGTGAETYEKTAALGVGFDR